MDSSTPFVKLDDTGLRVGDKNIRLDYVPQSIDLAPKTVAPNTDSLATWDVTWRARQEQRRLDAVNRVP